MSAQLRALEHRALLALDDWRAGRVPPLAERLTRLPTLTAGARLLAGQANAARGRELLWLVGGGRAGSTEPVATARSWFAAAAAHFEGLAPEAEFVALEDGTERLAAVAVRTARAPFTLRPRGARPGEVPWYDFSRRTLRSATRLDLVRLVTPLGELPQFEFLEAELTFFKNLQPRSRTTYRWTLDASVYVLPRSADRLILPFHKLRAEVGIGAWSGRAAELHLTADRQSPALRVTESALLADGLGRFFLYASGSTEVESLPWDEPAVFTAEFLPAGAELCALAQGRLQRETVLEANQMARWKSA
ncbi:MAG: hypothetical protein JSR82_19860 [Verrucomicrobia bacterium]|nr:hypothetical protein [Verrucomicrobiota bacterium]